MAKDTVLAVNNGVSRITTGKNSEREELPKDVVAFLAVMDLLKEKREKVIDILKGNLWIRVHLR
jgi:hypothetical protein